MVSTWVATLVMAICSGIVSVIGGPPRSIPGFHICFSTSVAFFCSLTGHIESSELGSSRFTRVTFLSGLMGHTKSGVRSRLDPRGYAFGFGGRVNILFLSLGFGSFSPWGSTFGLGAVYRL